jgi:hypothetical protein
MTGEPPKAFLPIRLHALWRVFIRILIALLAAAVILGLYLLLNPGALQDAILSLPIPEVVRYPALGPTPLPPAIQAAQGEVPRGALAFAGAYDGGTFACGFLLDLGNGLRVGVSAAHATAALPPGALAELRFTDGTVAATLSGQIGRGSPFVQDQFTMDYVLWAVAGGADPQLFLQPDERGQGQPGERVLVLSQAAGAPRRPGVVIRSSANATWIQMDDSFDPRGLSGCPVISQYTGRVIGMAVAGADKPPVVMGLHPVGSLVQKALAALSTP